MKEREISRQTGVLLQRQLADASKALTDAEVRGSVRTGRR